LDYIYDDKENNEEIAINTTTVPTTTTRPPPPPPFTVVYEIPPNGIIPVNIDARNDDFESVSFIVRT